MQVCKRAQYNYYFTNIEIGNGINSKYTCVTHVEWKAVDHDSDCKENLTEKDILEFLEILVPEYKNEWSNMIVDRKLFKKRRILLLQFTSVEHTAAILDGYQKNKKNVSILITSLSCLC